jgi:pimeloyl-ACP methyl ester carboxylesterase
MLLSRRRRMPADQPAFAVLTARTFAVGPARETMAVHVAGRVKTDDRTVVCVPGYQRNMSDFADFAGLYARAMGDDWGVVLVDLKGRGRSADRIDKSRYVSVEDARDLAQLCAALCLERAVFIGQGYGGQVVMALAAQRPTLLAGAVLIDAGPVVDPRGLVRLRNNLKDLDGPRSEAGLRSMFRRMLGTDYPGLPDALLDVLATRTHYLDRRGRVRPMFDAHLVRMLEHFEHDDVLVAQWSLFGALGVAPLMMMRTQLTDQLRREVFEEMLRRRRDADGYVIEAQASPALLNSMEDVEPIVDFVRGLAEREHRATAENIMA